MLSSAQILMGRWYAHAGGVRSAEGRLSTPHIRTGDPR